MTGLPADRSGPTGDEPTPDEARRAAEQRATRNAAKLAALVADRWDVRAPTDSLGTGAAMAVDGRAFVLLDEVRHDQPGRAHGLGAALAWARRAGATELDVVADADADGGTVARQAGHLATPIRVWASEGRTLHPVEPAPVDDGDGPPDAPELVALLEAAGLDVVVEGDRLSGEYRGLEVARVVRALDDGEPLLEVGVGKYDRALTAMVHGDLDGREGIARVVAQLEGIRRVDGPPNHPLATLVPERWLRATLVADPGRIGCDELGPASTPSPRDRLRPRGVAAAVGTRRGEPVVVVCSVGIDLEAPVLAADARAALDPDATLLVVVPERDVLPATTAMVEDLVDPAEVVPVVGEWRT